MRYKMGLIVGRFQPFHKGHLYLIKKALEQVDEIIILIGSANISDERNPFTYKERKKQILDSLEKNKISHKIKKIVSLDDHPDDDVWFKKLKKKSEKFDVSFGNNKWVNGILEQAGHNVIRVPFYKRHIYEGTKIRKKLNRSRKN